MTTCTDRFDVIILGGGPAGCAAAIAATRAGRQVIVLERAPRAMATFGETLAPEGAAAMQDLGLAKSLQLVDRVASVGTVSLWDAPEPVETDHIFNARGPGWNLERSSLNAALKESLTQHNIRFHTNISLHSHSRISSDDMTIRCCVGGRNAAFRGRWIVDATGRSGWLLRRVGVRRKRLDELVAIMFCIRGACSDQRLTIEAVPQGWWYYSPLPKERAVAAFVTDRDHLPPRPFANLEFWRTLLRESRLIRARVGNESLLSSPFLIDASIYITPKAAGRGWLAVGDAAIAHDPISGAGICRGLVSGAQAARCIAEGDSCDGTSSVRYQRWVEREALRYCTERARIYSLAAEARCEPFWANRRAIVGLNERD
jgi:2-polyprenyl-6-methoxyphenol hydroxylase-like FAD-dependent oxidoreductase